MWLIHGASIFDLIHKVNITSKQLDRSFGILNFDIIEYSEINFLIRKLVCNPPWSPADGETTKF